MHEWSFFVQNGWIQDGRIQDGCHHQVEWEWMSLSQIKLIWVRVRVEWECFWVNLREITRCLNPKWQCLNPTWLIQDRCHQEVESKWMSKVFLCKRLNLRWLPSSIWVRINEWRFLCKWWGTNEWVKFFCANGGNQSWQVWGSLRGKTQMAESKMMEFRITEFKMAAIINLSQNQWVKFFFPNGREGSVSEVFLVQMVGTNLGKCEWVREEILRWLNARWPNSRWQNSRWLPSSS